MGFFGNLAYSWKKNGDLAALIERYERHISRIMNDFDLSSEYDIVTEIYNYITNDERLRMIMQKHHATKDDVSHLFYALQGGGAAQKGGGNYPPISSFFFQSSLDYILTHKNDSPEELSLAMLEYFHI